MRVNRIKVIVLMLYLALLGLSVSCSKGESPTAAQTLSEQIQGDWKLVQCNEMMSAGGSVVYPVYEIGGLWKFFMSTDSPIGEIWINGTHKFHYIITGNMIRIYDDYTSDGYYRYTLVIASNGNTMRLLKLDSDELRFEFSKI